VCLLPLGALLRYKPEHPSQADTDAKRDKQLIRKSADGRSHGGANDDTE
jgi:hypothetical protein